MALTINIVPKFVEHWFREPVLEDIFIVAPATSNTISAMVNAKCDNILIATYLSCTAKVYVVPAMDLDMMNHSANQSNLKELKSLV